MERIKGLKILKNSKSKITHFTLSMKHHAKLLEDMLDNQMIVEGLKDEFIPWEKAKKDLEKIAKRKSLPFCFLQMPKLFYSNSLSTEKFSGYFGWMVL